MRVTKARVRLKLIQGMDDNEVAGNFEWDFFQSLALQQKLEEPQTFLNCRDFNKFLFCFFLKIYHKKKICLLRRENLKHSEQF